MKTLLKATQIQISPARAFTPHSMSTPKTNAIQPASPATQGWTRYINGGAAADDAAVRDNLRAQEAELLLKLSQDTGLPTEVPSHAQASLIDISDCSGPVQPSLSDGSSKQTLSSGKSDLLIDLGRNLEEARRTEKRNDNAPVKGKGKGKGKAAYVYNLLD